MLFDFSTMQIPEQNRVQEAALKFIREQMKPADVVAILSASTGPLKIVQDFTTDKDRLEEVVKGFAIGAASELAGVAGNGGDEHDRRGHRHGVQRRRNRVQYLQYR